MAQEYPRKVAEFTHGGATLRLVEVRDGQFVMEIKADSGDAMGADRWNRLTRGDLGEYADQLTKELARSRGLEDHLREVVKKEQETIDRLRAKLVRIRNAAVSADSYTKIRAIVDEEDEA